MAGRGAAVAGRSSAVGSTSKPGQAAKPAIMGPGAKMIEDMRKKGKPIDPKMEQMAAWLDNLAKDAGGEGMGEVGCHDTTVNPNLHFHKSQIALVGETDANCDDRPSGSVMPCHLLYLQCICRRTVLLRCHPWLNLSCFKRSISWLYNL